MKYVLLVPDGAADNPLPDLDHRTPLEVARTPALDVLASRGTVGVVHVTPPGMYPGSDAANMALLGYNPEVYYTGRGPIEAAAMRIVMDARDVAFRCSLVSTDGEQMVDYSAGHITSDEARPLIEAAQRICGRAMRLFPGVAYRHVLLWADGPAELLTHPPHENMGKPLAEILPTGEQEGRLRQFIWDSLELLDALPFNRRRRDQGLLPANLLWPWGQGRAPSLPLFLARHGRGGAVVAGVDVVRGLGRLTGLEVLDVPGATGGLDTDYYAKARYAVEALNRHDFVWLHVEAPDEAGHQGNLDAKIEAIEKIDALVVRTLLDRLHRVDDFRLLVVPDHATPVTTRGHQEGPVPYLLYDSRETAAGTHPFDERVYHERVPRVDEGYRLIESLFRS